VMREDQSEPRARFIGRIMFPILDELGHHVAFGGRAMGDATPKYLNSGESEVFHKRRTLYGMHTAKNAMRRVGRAIVVEGYLDAIRLALAGLEEVVAPLGTALTEEQASLLLRYATEVFLLYDSDEAGQKATFRSGLELLRHKAAVRVVSLPEGEDPDTFVRSHGRAAMEKQLSLAIDLFDRQIQMAERRGYFADIAKRRSVIDKLLPTIRAARDPLTREMYLSRLAEVSHLDKATLASEADEPPTTTRGMRAAREGRDGPPADDGAPPPDFSPAAVNDEATAMPMPFQKRPWTGRRGKAAGPEWHATAVPPRPRRDEPAERAIVRAMITDRGFVERVAERHAPSDFRDPNYREIFAALLSAGHDDALDSIEGALSSSAMEVLRELTEHTDTLAPEQVDVTLSLARLDARRLEARIDEIRTLMREATPEAQDTLMRERMELEVEVRRLLPIRSPRAKPKGV
jgi:DNA primase